MFTYTYIFTSNVLHIPNTILPFHIFIQLWIHPKYKWVDVIEQIGSLVHSGLHTFFQMFCG